VSTKANTDSSDSTDSAHGNTDFGISRIQRTQHGFLGFTDLPNANTDFGIPGFTERQHGFLGFNGLTMILKPIAEADR
jgi:hypothetical protein